MLPRDATWWVVPTLRTPVPRVDPNSSVDHDRGVWIAATTPLPLLLFMAFAVIAVVGGGSTTGDVDDRTSSHDERPVDHSDR